MDLCSQTQEEALQLESTLIICLLLITSHFRLSIKRSVKFFYLAPILHLLGWALFSAASLPSKSCLHFFSSFRV